MVCAKSTRMKNIRDVRGVHSGERQEKIALAIVTLFSTGSNRNVELSMLNGQCKNWSRGFRPTFHILYTALMNHQMHESLLSWGDCVIYYTLNYRRYSSLIR